MHHPLVTTLIAAAILLWLHTRHQRKREVQRLVGQLLLEQRRSRPGQWNRARFDAARGAPFDIDHHRDQYTMDQHHARKRYDQKLRHTVAILMHEPFPREPWVPPTRNWADQTAFRCDELPPQVYVP